MHIIPWKISEYGIHYHENYLQYCLCAGTVVTSLKDGFHIDIEIAGKIMSYSYICIIFISNIIVFQQLLELIWKSPLSLWHVVTLMTSLWCHFVVNSNYFLLQVPQETTARGQPKGDAKFYLKTFDTTVDTHLQS